MQEKQGSEIRLSRYGYVALTCAVVSHVHQQGLQSLILPFGLLYTASVRKKTLEGGRVGRRASAPTVQGWQLEMAQTNPPGDGLVPAPVPSASVVRRGIAQWVCLQTTLKSAAQKQTMEVLQLNVSFLTATVLCKAWSARELPVNLQSAGGRWQRSLLYM